MDVTRKVLHLLRTSYTMEQASNKHIADKVGVTVEQVKTALEILKSMGFLETYRKRFELGDHWQNQRTLYLTEKGKYEELYEGTPPKKAGTEGVKLSPELAQEIRQKHTAGQSQLDLAQQYQVRKQTIWSIVHNRSWKSGAQ